MIKKATVPKKIPINLQVITFLSRVASGKDNPTTAIMKAMAVPALKEELHGIHGSLKHTVQRERAAFKALEAAKESADNIVDGISNAIVKVEKNTVIHAKVDDRELAKVNQCSADHIKAEKKLLEEHSKKLAKHLQKNEDIWLSSFWTKIMMSFFIFYTILLLIYAYIK